MRINSEEEYQYILKQLDAGSYQKIQFFIGGRRDSGEPEGFQGMIQMNVTGGFLWECLSEERTKQELIDLFLEKYDASREDAEADVNTFIENLSKAGILEV